MSTDAHNPSGPDGKGAPQAPSLDEIAEASGVSMMGEIMALSRLDDGSEQYERVKAGLAAFFRYLVAINADASFVDRAAVIIYIRP